MAIKVRKRGEGDESPEDEDQPEQTANIDPAGGDPFMRGSMRTMSWLADNQVIVASTVVLIAVGAAVAYYARSYMHEQAVAASSGVIQAGKALDTPVKGSPTMQMLTVEEVQKYSTAPDEPYSSEKERWTKVYERAGQTLENHADSAPATSAKLVRAAAALRLEKYKESVELYRAYLDASPPASTTTMAHYGLSVALAEQGKYDKAVSALDKMSDNYKGFALYHKGLYMEEAGNIEKAKKFYNKVLETNPKSPYKTDIERRLALL